MEYIDNFVLNITFITKDYLISLHQGDNRNEALFRSHALFKQRNGHWPPHRIVFSQRPVFPISRIVAYFISKRQWFYIFLDPGWLRIYNNVREYANDLFNIRQLFFVQY